MKTVQPIRDREVLDRCYRAAREHDRRRRKGEVCWELLLLVGLHTGLRISDIRRLRVRDVRGRDYVEIRAQKTGKESRILIAPPARKPINRLLAGREPGEYILQSREKDAVTHREKPISRQQAYRIMDQIAKRAGIQDRIGCHTLRKTFGYHYYKMTGDVVSLQRILCHSSRRETLIYIGVVQEEIDESLMKFDLTGKK